MIDKLMTFLIMHPFWILILLILDAALLAMVIAFSDKKRGPSAFEDFVTFYIFLDNWEKERKIDRYWKE